MAADRSYDAGPVWRVITKSTASGDATTPLVVTDAPAAGKVIIADDLWVTSEVAQNITVRNTSGTTVLVGPLYVAEGGLLPLTFRNGIKASTADSTLQIVGDQAGNVKVYCSWHEV